ncbi:MAG: sulfotransferase domain-containing protein [Candidatus Scalinduaceae bacterium]
MTGGLTLGDTPRKKAIVISHERSGTHFLMNTLALNFGYISKPWINFDFEIGINFHSSRELLAFFKKMHDLPILNIIKSHHHISFFSDFIDYLAEQFHIFYIYRDPRDVMVSFWRLIQNLSWDEGPKTDSVCQFMRTAPRGAILRYQKEQSPTILHRWQDHVIGWINFAEESRNQKAIVIRYEDLNLKFDEIVKEIGIRIDFSAEKPKRPDREDNVILPGTGQVSDYRKFFTQEDRDFILNTVGETMNRLCINLLQDRQA